MCEHVDRVIHSVFVLFWFTNFFKFTLFENRFGRRRFWLKFDTLADKFRGVAFTIPLPFVNVPTAFPSVHLT